MRQSRFGGGVAAPQVADQRLAQFGRAVGRAIGAKPPAERAHHSPDLLADDHVAEPDLAHLPVHVVHEQFGKLDAGEPLPGIFVDPVEDECEHQIDHVEAAVERVGNASLRIPVRRARGGDDGVPQRAPRLARIGFGFEEFAERRKHGATLRPNHVGRKGA